MFGHVGWSQISVIAAVRALTWILMLAVNEHFSSHEPAGYPSCSVSCVIRRCDITGPQGHILNHKTDMDDLQKLDWCLLVYKWMSGWLDKML